MRNKSYHVFCSLFFNNNFLSIINEQLFLVGDTDVIRDTIPEVSSINTNRSASAITVETSKGKGSSSTLTLEIVSNNVQNPKLSIKYSSWNVDESNTGIGIAILDKNANTELWNKIYGNSGNNPFNGEDYFKYFIENSINLLNNVYASDINSSEKNITLTLTNLPNGEYNVKVALYDKNNFTDMVSGSSNIKYSSNYTSFYDKLITVSHSNIDQLGGTKATKSDKLALNICGPSFTEKLSDKRTITATFNRKLNPETHDNNIITIKNIANTLSLDISTVKTQNNNLLITTTNDIPPGKYYVSIINGNNTITDTSGIVFRGNTGNDGLSQIVSFISSDVTSIYLSPSSTTVPTLSGLNIEESTSDETKHPAATNTDGGWIIGGVNFCKDENSLYWPVTVLPSGDEYLSELYMNLFNGGKDPTNYKNNKSYPELQLTLSDTTKSSGIITNYPGNRVFTGDDYNGYITNPLSNLNKWDIANNTIDFTFNRAINITSYDYIQHTTSSYNTNPPLQYGIELNILQPKVGSGQVIASWPVNKTTGLPYKYSTQIGSFVLENDYIIKYIRDYNNTILWKFISYPGKLGLHDKPSGKDSIINYGDKFYIQQKSGWYLVSTNTTYTSEGAALGISGSTDGHTAGRGYTASNIYPSVSLDPSDTELGEEHLWCFVGNTNDLLDGTKFGPVLLKDQFKIKNISSGKYMASTWHLQPYIDYKYPYYNSAPAYGGIKLKEDNYLIGKEPLPKSGNQDYFDNCNAIMTSSSDTYVNSSATVFSISPTHYTSTGFDVTTKLHYSSVPSMDSSDRSMSETDITGSEAVIKVDVTTQQMSKYIYKDDSDSITAKRIYGVFGTTENFIKDTTEETKTLFLNKTNDAVYSDPSFDVNNYPMNDLILKGNFSRDHINPDNTKKAGITVSYDDYSRKIKLSVNRSLSGISGDILVFRMKAKVKPPLLSPIVMWPWLIPGNTTDTDATGLTTSYVAPNNNKDGVKDGKYHLDIDLNNPVTNTTDDTVTLSYVTDGSDNWQYFSVTLNTNKPYVSIPLDSKTYNVNDIQVRIIDRYLVASQINSNKNRININGTPLKIETTNPVKNATDILLDTSVVLNFNKKLVFKGEGNIYFTPTPKPSDRETIVLDINNSNLTITNNDGSSDTNAKITISNVGFYSDENSLKYNVTYDKGILRDQWGNFWRTMNIFLQLQILNHQLCSV